MNIQEEYQRILEEHQEQVVSAGFSGTEQRAHPRLKVSSNDLWIETVPEFAMVDMSATGIAILSNQPLQVGEMLHVSLGSALSVDTEVVACHMEHPPDEYIDGQFRIQCRFLEDLRGMELLVRTVRSN